MKTIITTLIDQGKLPITGKIIPKDTLKMIVESIDLSKTYGMRNDDTDELLDDESFKIKSALLSENDTLIVELEYQDEDTWLRHTHQQGKYSFSVKVDKEIEPPTIKLDNIVYLYMK